LFVNPVRGIGIGPLVSTRSKAVKRPHRAGAFARTLGVVGVVVVVALSGVQSGCETTPIRSLRGARHYAAGNDALARSDSARAVAELERAAALVPHASEIQNHLGLTYWSEGRVDAARISFERALELNCENQAAEANLESLMNSNRSTLDTRYTNDAQSGQVDGVGGSADGG
jgi:cytochrome c-type biogenesis protein CcmH/NrfG